MTIVFADPTAGLMSGMGAEPTHRDSGRRARPFGTAAVRTVDPQPGAVRRGVSAVLLRVARSIDPSVAQGVAVAR